MAGQSRIVSGDSHLDLPPERWTHRVPDRWRERAPRTVTLANGSEAMIVENRSPRPPAATAITGIPYQQHGLQKVAYEGPGTGPPEQRVREQDQDGIDAEVLFVHAAYVSFWRGISDDEAYRAVIRAFNEWLAEEYCAAAPDRLIGMGIIPDTGVDDAIEEMEHCARLGLKGVSIVRFPSGKGYPTPEDDRFWEAALGMKMPLTSHTNGGTTRFTREGPIFVYKGQSPAQRNAERDPMSLLFRFAGEAPMVPMQMAMTGVFDRFPKLKIYWAETQAGWLSYSLVQLDDNHERNRYWGARDYGFEPPAHPPSYYMRENSLWGFMKDPVGVRLRHDVGVENLIWGSDFAHATGDWPNSRQVIEEIFVAVPEDEKYRMVAGNVVDFFNLDGRKPTPANTQATARASA